MNNLLTFVDIYCERLAPGLLGEPLNAASNAAFFLAAWLLWRKRAALSRHTSFFATLIALIGAGSLSFHTFANMLTGVLDIAFIGVFILCFIYRFFPAAYGGGRRASLFGIGAFVLLYVALDALFAAHAVPLPAIYAASLLLLMCLSVDLSLRRHVSARWFALAATAFAFSLSLRTLDEPWCDALPMGTHFFWHLFNAVVLYALVRALSRAEKSTAGNAFS